MKRTVQSLRSRLFASSVLALVLGAVQAQPTASLAKQGLLVPTSAPAASGPASSPPQASFLAPPAGKASSALSAAKSVSSMIAAAAASSPSAAASSVPDRSPSSPLPRARQASGSSHVATDSAEGGRLQGATVQRRADGTQVFKTPINAAMLQEEQRVAALNSPPAVSPASAEASRKPPLSPSNLAAFLGSAGETLPDWAKSGVARTNGKSRLVVAQGVTEMVTIAKNFPNRFITPFEAAEVVTTDPDLSHEGYGGAVILATAADKPIGVFIQDKYSDRSIGLVLVPEVVPQRELRLVLDESWTAPVLRPNPDATDVQMPAAANDYVEYVKALLRALAKGDVPDGHALTPVDIEQLPKCMIPGVSAKPAQMLEGPTTRIGVYVATNNTSSSLPVQEAGCYRKGVLAVSAFPRPVLEAGQSTELYVLMRKDVVTQTVTGKRRPVLVSQ